MAAKESDDAAAGVTASSRQKILQPPFSPSKRVSFEIDNDERPPPQQQPALSDTTALQNDVSASNNQNGDDGYKDFLRLLTPTPPTMPSSDEDESDGNVPPPPAAQSSSDQQDDAGQVGVDGHGELITLNQWGYELTFISFILMPCHVSVHKIFQSVNLSP